ncbi:MAG: flagellar biosynthesis protein FlhA [candidate division FCPU426 bacterium]
MSAPRPAWLGRVGEMSVVGGIILLLVIMVIPMPTSLLSLLLVVNLSLALVILMVSVYIGKPLEFSSFPSLLLIMTLFDLTLHIASTRKILTESNAGEVIRGFGEVMTGGNPGVGLVLFVIITIVQFVVITKGAERISEVSARFTLDAMPGKQMSIDADLNAGLISNEEAKARRAEIGEEANFYGAMDGASKFVKGNVIAAFVIIVINIVGGLLVGLFKQKMAWGEIFYTYTLLTIGEGLVIILPSFLVAVASAIIITRAASRSNLGADSLRQIVAKPQALMIVAAATFLFGFAGLFTELPVLPFWIMSALLGGGARLVQTWQRQEDEAAAAQQATKPEEPAEFVAPFLLVPPVELELGHGLLGLVDAERQNGLLHRIRMIRQNLAVELGVVVPPIRVKDNIKLPTNGYAIRIKGVERALAEIYPGHYLALASGGQAAGQQLPGIKTKEPTFQLDAVWVTEGWKDRAELAGYTVVDAATVLVTNLMEVLRAHAHEILGRQEVQVLIDHLRPTNPAVIEELLPNVLSAGEVQQVLRNLLRERVPIRDLVTILETLSQAARMTKDADLLTEQVRLALGSTICQQFQSDKNLLSVVTVDPAIERLIADSTQNTAHGYTYSVEPGILQKLYTQLTQLMGRIMPRLKQPVVLCSPQVRMHFKRMTERVFPQLVVLSYNEIPQQMKVQSLGMLEMPAGA